LARIQLFQERELVPPQKSSESQLESDFFMEELRKTYLEMAAVVAQKIPNDSEKKVFLAHAKRFNFTERYLFLQKKLINNSQNIRHYFRLNGPAFLPVYLLTKTFIDSLSVFCLVTGNFRLLEGLAPYVWSMAYSVLLTAPGKIAQGIRLKPAAGGSYQLLAYREALSQRGKLIHIESLELPLFFFEADHFSRESILFFMSQRRNYRLLKRYWKESHLNSELFKKIHRSPLLSKEEKTIFLWSYLLEESPSHAFILAKKLSLQRLPFPLKKVSPSVHEAISLWVEQFSVVEDLESLKKFLMEAPIELTPFQRADLLLNVFLPHLSRILLKELPYSSFRSFVKNVEVLSVELSQNKLHLESEAHWKKKIELLTDYESFVSKLYQNCFKLLRNLAS